MPGPCLYLLPWSTQSSREPLLAKLHMYIHGTGLSTLCAVTARPGLSGMSQEIFSPFSKWIQRDLDALPLERDLVGKRKRGREKNSFLDFLFVGTGFGGQEMRIHVGEASSRFSERTQ